MNLRKFRNYGLLGLVVCALSYGAGYYTAPGKVIIEKLTSDSTKKTGENNVKTVERFDPRTGKITERVHQKILKDTEQQQSKTFEHVEKTKAQKIYALKGGVAYQVGGSKKEIYRGGAEVRLPLDLWLGLETDIKSDPAVGTYLRIEF